jgi:hypothetical protein
MRKSITGIQDLDPATKRDVATRILYDLRMIDSATDQYAIENNKNSGLQIEPQVLSKYLSPQTRIYKHLINGRFDDPLGHSYGRYLTVDSLPAVPKESYQALSEAVGAEFWSPYH